MRAANVIRMQREAATFHKNLSSGGARASRPDYVFDPMSARCRVAPWPPRRVGRITIKRAP
eukprot:1042153-Lingulodinium_polyedra.AAC.1